ncbi:MAG: hypothetical protein NTX88_04315 [Candidatus Atribacteria bacterium]|nr:hypothetical protein [Candidatus Atribacteria bacterium]
MDFGFGDRIFVSVMTMFGLAFLWLAWWEAFLPLWLVPLIGLGFALTLVIPWYRRYNREREEGRKQLQRMKNGNLRRVVE